MQNVNLPERRNLYHQVRDIIANRIKDGHWSEGAYLPNEFDLSEEFRVSIGTIRKAVDLLVEENFVERRHGRGTYIHNRRWELARRRFRKFRKMDQLTPIQWNLHEIDRTQAVGDVQTRQFLGLDPGEEVHLIRRMRQAKECGVIYELIYIPVRLFPALPPPNGSAFRVVALMENSNRELGQIDARVSACVAPADVLEKLQVASQTPILRVTQVIRDSDQTPMSYSIKWCALDESVIWCHCD